VPSLKAKAARGSLLGEAVVKTHVRSSARATPVLSFTPVPPPTMRAVYWVVGDRAGRRERRSSGSGVVTDGGRHGVVARVAHLEGRGGQRARVDRPAEGGRNGRRGNTKSPGEGEVRLTWNGVVSSTGVARSIAISVADSARL